MNQKLLLLPLALAACGEQRQAATPEPDLAAQDKRTPANEQSAAPSIGPQAGGGGASVVDATEVMRWTFNRTAAGPKLAYGEPRTDNVRLMLRCEGDQIVLTFMRSAEVVARRPDHVTVASGAMQWRTGITAQQSQLGGMSISASAPVSSAPMTAFSSGEALELRWGEETISVPGTDQAKPFLTACN